VIVAPYDDADHSLDHLLHGSSSDRLPGVTMTYGAPAFFDVDRVRALDALLATVPDAAIGAAALGLSALDDAADWTAEGYAVRLDRVRKFVAAARAANASLLAAVH
jgi:hypothetical protein